MEESDRVAREHFEKNYLPNFRAQWARLGLPDPGDDWDVPEDILGELFRLAALPTPGTEADTAEPSTIGDNHPD